MAEWLKARASKACIPLRVSGVRIPLSPPDFKPRLTPSFKQGSPLSSGVPAIVGYRNRFGYNAALSGIPTFPSIK